MEKKQAKGLFCTLRGYSWRYLPKDIFVGIIIAAVSIPIAMGYAEVSGLPPVYGLYGSVLPIIVFAAVTRSRQFILGVDATPAALAGATIASFGIVGGTPEAMAFVPMMALFTCLWLLLFYFLKAGRIVNFISSPVMGGFISGIGVEIILMQIPKLMGGKAEAGEAPELIGHILETAREINPVSLLLGVCSLVIILVATRFIPKFPMPIFVMAAGAGLTAVLHLEQYDVALLSHVDPGFPGIILPDFVNMEITHVVGKSLMVAAVVMAETLLAENEFALKNGYKINENREILACALANGAAALTGSCPVNGSISRTSMNDQYGGHTQLVSVVAGIVMLALLFTGTGFIEYLPVPVLTAIVICALMKVVEVHLALRLWKVRKRDFWIFVAAMLGVLFLGTVYGVVIGMLLSFIVVITEVIVEVTNPPRAFLGKIPEKEGLYNLQEREEAEPIHQMVVYQFGERLFFANIKIFQQDIENSIKEDTKAVIVDGGAISSIDLTAADRLEILADNLEKQGIHFYLTEVPKHLEEQLAFLGEGTLIRDEKVLPTVEEAVLEVQKELEEA
ncbi:MAG TPA: SulP family inorganic anion transporter [Candidatus Dorea merdavium]|nr:SulP family inorganic anion transporter [Candidatus Dorea merdavium]